jgi:capsular polysaccharide transport system permease protein
MRHFVLLGLFALLVLLPSALYATYLYTVAVDQYESDVGFGSRTEQASNTFDILGVLGGGSGAATKDMDILNQFVTSQELVERIDRKLNLRKIWSSHPRDWIFAFPKDGTIEDLVDYWNKMIVVNYDNSTGLMSLKVFAFSPEDAQAIAAEIVVESGDIINELSKTAQDDTTRYSRDTLAKAEERYRKAQTDLSDFRVKNRIIDPQMQLNGASQIINGLVQQMAESQINLELLRGQVADSDPRITQLTRRIDVIQKRISEETSKVGTMGDPSDPGYAALISQYQNLNMEMEFSQKSYMAAQGAYDQAVNDATQQTHYLATFLAPTLAESTTAPDRPLHIFLIALVGLLAWAALAMIYYALRDRR